MYFPLKDMGKKFIVHSTEIFSTKVDKKYLDFFKKFPSQNVTEYGKLAWNEIKKDKKFLKKYKNCWLCLVYITQLDTQLEFHIDVLKPIK